MEEFWFICEVCGKQFPADPGTILECKADFKAIDPESGESVEITDEMRRDILEDAQKDPEIAPFIKGTICICHECQGKMAATSLDAPEEF